MFLAMKSRVLVALFLLATASANYLRGEPHACKEDLDAQRKTSNLRMPCISCSCVNGEIVCTRNCPKLEGCYNLISQNDDTCDCKSCQGCSISNNRSLVHGGLAREGCTTEQCDSGVSTVTRLECHVPCVDPLPPPVGQCCPACRGCSVEGRLLRSGETVTISTDSCVVCECMGNSLVCSKQACPVLSCPEHKVRKLPGHCCPSCMGERNKFFMSLPHGRCLLNRYLQNNGSTNSMDPCTACTCNNGDITCRRKTCPPLTCPRRYQEPPSPSECCPSCKLPEVSPECRHKGQLYHHGETWHPEKCTTCTCNHGKMLCHMDPCPGEARSCPPGHKREIPPDSCCPVCTPQFATCLAYGSPHYKTFDNYTYTFEGDCKYTLAKDCSQRSQFRLKMINHPNGANSVAPVARSAVLKLLLDGQRIKVTMMVNRKTKVNSKRVRLPYHYASPPVLTINRNGYGIELNTTTGLRLVWDGQSYIELILDSRWRNKTCGLCGNYNGIPKDDLMAGRRRSMSMSNRIQPFEDIKKKHADSARRWARGRCLREDRLRITQIEGRRNQRLSVCLYPSTSTLASCSHFNSSSLTTCRQLVDVEPFYRACLDDMCSCHHKQCQCASLLAYTRECQRYGVEYATWRTDSTCGGLECPHGAVFMQCAPQCKPTCRNKFPDPKCHQLTCKPGCYCPHPTVRHRGSCIQPENCPKKRVRNKRPFMVYGNKNFLSRNGLRRRISNERRSRGRYPSYRGSRDTTQLTQSSGRVFS